ncbi:hypothetical protein [Tautonia sociabilis]|uniref:YfhO family protein n=1 Tax=Tautonia sociabilis TaxID=2080755 RepID=A0A432MMP3_9BACT|nr:hypothetical protein [Tautonia sociabilis]RUL88692.1 hypothetical protein TsocGM_06025 [Tautonia sociabilis]
MATTTGRRGDRGGARTRRGATGAVAALVVAASGLVLLGIDPDWFWHDDFQTYQLAVYRDVARAWSAGELPLLSPSSWQGGALAGEYQPAVFSPVLTAGHLLLFGLGLSLPQVAAALVIAHLALLAAGTARLGARLGLPDDLATFAALVAAFNGSVMLWGARAWFPALASLAWLPWFWWAALGAIDPGRGRARFVPAGLFLALIVASGWPFSVLMAAVLTAWLSAREVWRRRSIASSWPLAAAWAAGLGLSAPAWLMLVEYSSATIRGGTAPWSLGDNWSVPLESLPGLLFPPHVADWTIFRGRKPHASLELAGALAPLVVLLAALGRRPGRLVREAGWELAFLGLLMALAMLPGVGNFRWSFRWLPFAFLVLGIASARVLAGWRAQASLAEGGGQGGPPPSNLGLWAVSLVLAGWMLQEPGTDPSGFVDRVGLALTGMALFWAAVEGWRGSAAVRSSGMPALFVVGSGLVSYVGVDPFVEYPCWRPSPADAAAPADRDARSFGIYAYSDVYPGRDPFRAFAPWDDLGRGTSLLPGNSAMYSGVEQVNGYSPMLPRALAELFDFGYFGHIEGPLDLGPPPTVLRLFAKDARPGALLDRMGVDALIVSNRYLGLAGTLPGQGWRRARTLPDGAVFRRVGGALPRVRAVRRARVSGSREEGLAFLRDPEADPELPVLLAEGHQGSPAGRPFARASVTTRRASRCRVVVDVRAEEPGLAVVVAFARPWYPGYRATFEGRPVPVDRLDLILPAVRLPAGAAGRLVLEYRPRSFRWGIRVASATGLFVLAVTLGSWGRRPSADPGAVG